MGIGTLSTKKPDVLLECFLSCAALGSTDTPRKDGLSPFAVIYLKRNGGDEFTEIARTETCANTNSPSFCTSFEVGCSAQEVLTTSVRVEIYHRMLEGVESLDANELFGRTIFPLKDLRDARGMHFLASLSHPTKERERVGIVQLKAEHSCLSTTANELVEIDLMAAVLRRRDWSQSAKVVSQSYAIFRAHAYDDEEGQVTWLPIYRSDRVNTHSKKSEHVDFSRATMTNRHLCNGDEERRIRIALQAGNLDKKTGRANEMGYVDITLRDLCEVDPTEEVFEIENTSDADEDDVGSLTLLMAQPTDVGSHFILQANHASCTKYVSSSSPANKRSRSMGKKLKRRRNGLKNISKKLEVKALRAEDSECGDQPSTQLSNLSLFSEEPHSQGTSPTLQLQGLFPPSFPPASGYSSVMAGAGESTSGSQSGSSSGGSGSGSGSGSGCGSRHRR